MPTILTLPGLPQTLPAYSYGYASAAGVTIPAGTYVKATLTVNWTETGVTAADTLTVSAGAVAPSITGVNLGNYGTTSAYQSLWRQQLGGAAGYTVTQDVQSFYPRTQLNVFNSNAPGSLYSEFFWELDLGSAGAITLNSAYYTLYTAADLQGAGGGSGGSGAGTGTGTGSIGSNPGLCVLQFTRPIMRDEIRIMLGLIPTSQYIQGAIAGEEPPGEKWPGNLTINTAIANAIRAINLRTGFHATHALSVNVPAYIGVGPQWVKLQGIGAGPWQNLINDVERAIWYDGTTYTRLRPRSFWDMDRNHYQFDSLAPGLPATFGIHAYELGLLPGAQAAGTLQLWAGTGLIGFCSDTDVIDELSIDEQLVIEMEAVRMLRMMRPDEENAKDQMAVYGAAAERGAKQIERDLTIRSAMEQSTLSAASRRRRRYF